MAGFDLALLHRYPRFVAALLVVLLIPALYAGIYLSSMWDPAAHTQALKVALVNEDQGAEVQGRRVELGAQVLASLRLHPAFNYELYDNTEAARHAVRTGAVSFAVLIPPDFSHLAVPGERVGAGRLVVYASEGNNYASAGFARRFAPEVAHRVNQALNEERWSVVLQTAAGAATSVDQLRTGVNSLVHGATQLNTAVGQARSGATALAGGSRQLAQGNAKLHTGLQTLEGGSQQLTTGMKQAGAAVRTMNDRQPAAADLQALRAGSRQLASGQRELGQGLRQLQDGAAQLRDGSAQLGEEGGKILLVGGRIAEAADKLESGAEQLHKGLGSAATGSDSLAEGAVKLHRGVITLTNGMGQFGTGLSQLATALPADRQLDAYASGVRDAASASAELARGAQSLSEGTTRLGEGLGRLSDGSAQLREGLLLLASRLPADPAAPTGTASGLSESVQPVLEMAAPVANQGSGYAPNFIPLAIWVGATICTFLFAYRVLPDSLKDESGLALVLGKLAMPALLVVGQSLVMLAMLFGLLDIQVDSVPRFVVTLLLTGLAFLCLIFALVRILGDAGKLVALVLLVLQLAAAGATLPIELTTRFFQTIHPYLPLTWVVRAVRIAMFGAFEGAWAQSAGVIALFAVGCVTLAALLGRWRLVAPADYRPQIETE